MSRGHGVIINTGNFLPFIFIYNPEELESTKEINFFETPNIGGSHRQLFFTGFANNRVKFSLIVIDMEDPLGVNKEIAYFESLREPDPGLLGIAGSFFGNENYPPPKVMFNFGTGSLVPLLWDVMDISIKKSLFKAGATTGVLGIPKRADITCEFSLDEDSIVYKANQISKKFSQIQGSAMSITKEVLSNLKEKRKEDTGIYPKLPGFI